MNKRESLIRFIVISALLGYIVCSIWMFIQSFGTKGAIDQTLSYITNILTGLVGGVVATALGVKQTDMPSPSSSNAMRRVGVFLSPKTEDKSKSKQLGMLYAWSYVIVGIVSVIVWSLVKGEPKILVGGTATTFIGMVIAVVTGEFKKT